MRFVAGLSLHRTKCSAALSVEKYLAIRTFLRSMLVHFCREQGLRRELRECDCPCVLG